MLIKEELGTLDSLAGTEEPVSHQEAYLGLLQVGISKVGDDNSLDHAVCHVNK
jgi:hypothetical protein